jgi:hypothetical protein
MWAMPVREIIDLPHASVEVEERPGYLFVVETGTIKSLREVKLYAEAIDRIIKHTKLDRAIIDARGEVGDAPAEVRQAMWDWLTAPDRSFKMVAFVLASEMAVARVNMTALSLRANARAFENVQQAQRWLTRERRNSVMTLPSIAPVAPDPRDARKPPSYPAPPESTERPSVRQTTRPPSATPPPARQSEPVPRGHTPSPAPPAPKKSGDGNGGSQVA